MHLKFTVHCVWNARVTDINASLITKLVIDVFHTTASCACACVVFENLRISLKYFSKSNFGKLSSLALISFHFQYCILESGKEKIIDIIDLSLRRLLEKQ